MSPAIPMLLNEVDNVEAYMRDDNWALQEKHDGQRLQIQKFGDVIYGYNKKGQRIEVPEEFCSVLQKTNFNFMIDGESCGATFHAFDIVELEGQNYTALQMEERYDRLGMLVRSINSPVISLTKMVTGKAAKAAFMKEMILINAEGLVFRALGAGYTSGRPNSGGAILKFKFKASATCQVMKVNDKRSVLVGVSGLAHHTIIEVGNVTIPVNHEVPKVGDLVEVEYLYYYEGGSLFQPAYKGKRTDSDIDHIDSLKRKRE
jgi:bifunctional non-homologous end joining protein LigD